MNHGMDTNKKQIWRVACLARADFESNFIPFELLAELYGRYNSAVEVRSFLIRARQLFPALNCGVTSVYLRHVLQKGEIISGRYAEQKHTFLLVGMLVVDITADQFGGPSVYVGQLRAPWSL